jgi:hypothetical protein
MAEREKTPLLGYFPHLLNGRKEIDGFCYIHAANLF